MKAEQLLAALLSIASQGGAAKGRKGKNKKGRVLLTDAEKAANAKLTDAETVKVFAKAGYKDVQPRINVKVYGKTMPDGTKTGWLADGRRVRKGETAIKVTKPNGGVLNLFHIDQTDVEVEAAAVAAQQAQAATHQAPLQAQ